MRKISNRDQKGLSQQQFGMLIGVSGRQVGNYEKKGAIPTKEKLAKIKEVIELGAPAQQTR